MEQASGIASVLTSPATAGGVFQPRPGPKVAPTAKRPTEPHRPGVAKISMILDTKTECAHKSSPDQF